MWAGDANNGKKVITSSSDITLKKKIIATQCVEKKNTQKELILQKLQMP